MSSTWLPIALAAPWLGAVAVATLRRSARPWIERLALAAIVVSAIAVILSSSSGAVPTFDAAWIPSLGVRFRLRLDGLSLPFVVNLLGVSAIAVTYAWGYAANHERLPIYYALLLAFAGSMLGSTLAADALVFFVFWELMLVTSSLLLLGWGQGDRVGQVTLKYFLYTQAGSLLVLAALLWLVSRAGSTDLTLVTQAAAGMTARGRLALLLLMLVGFGVKMAIFPLHTWLPDAHSIASMPVTIMLAAAMLSMGAYGLLRFSLLTLGAETWALVQLPLMILALVSEIYGALMSLASSDVKRIVAYSSVSQLGYVLYGLASLTAQGIGGGVIQIISHGLLKAALFMGVGLVMRGTGRRRIDEIGGLFHEMAGPAVGITLAAIAITGMPPFCAFHGEWQIILGGLSSGQGLLGYLELLAPLATTMYALSLALRLGLGDYEGPDLQETPAAMRWTLYVTVALCALLGLWPAPLYRLAEGAVALLGLGG